MTKKAKSASALLLAALMAIGLAGCGNEGSTEETVEITTVSQEQTQEVDYSSQYEKIYNNYNDKMKAATEEYVREVSGQADDIETEELYDLVKEKTDALDKIRKEGADKMTDQTLDSTEDDQKEYEKWYSKLSEQYSEYSKELTEIYTDKF